VKHGGATCRFLSCECLDFFWLDRLSGAEIHSQTNTAAFHIGDNIGQKFPIGI
jgi:hypothetical protein